MPPKQNDKFFVVFLNGEVKNLVNSHEKILAVPASYVKDNSKYNSTLKNRQEFFLITFILVIFLFLSILNALRIIYQLLEQANCVCSTKNLVCLLRSAVRITTALFTRRARAESAAAPPPS